MSFTRNEVTLVGCNLTKDAETKSTQNGLAICNFSVAVNERRKNANGEWEDAPPSFFDVTCFGKTAESVSRDLVKGVSVIIIGRLKQDRWQDKNTGENRARVVINADLVRILHRQKKSDQQQFNQAPPQQYEQQQQFNNSDFNDDECPF